MAKSNAERQATYRERQRQRGEDHNINWRLSFYMPGTAHYQLKTLADLAGLSKRDMVLKFIQDAWAAEEKRKLAEREKAP
jgi:hypothetical protein